MFKLSRRKGSTLFQVRKRWPQDVVAVLRGEFTRSTGESDRKRAQERLPLIAAEYEAQIKAARDRLADNTLRDLSEPEMNRLAAAFYRSSLPAFRIGNAISPVEQQDLLRDSRAKLDALTRMMGRKEFSPVAGIARGIIQREGLPISDDSPSLPALQGLLMRAFIELHRGVVAQLEGSTDYRPTDPVAEEPAAKSDKRSKTVADLIKAYKADKEQSWSKSTTVAYEPVWRLLRDVLGNSRDLATITRDDGRLLFETVKALPKGLGKVRALSGLTVPQAVEKGRELGLPTLGPKSISDSYMSFLKSIFKWAVAEQWIAANPVEGLSVKDTVAAADKRDPFTTQQLKTIFGGSPWKSRDDAPNAKPLHFWGPLVALFHGMRRGEIARLDTADIITVNGHRVILIRTGKTANARRMLPVHPELVKMGFLRFVDGQRKAGHTQLFPGEAANSRGQWGDGLSDWFTRLITAHKLTGARLGMHSLRHNFEDRLREAGLHGTAIGAELAGRTKGGDVSSNYGSGFATTTLADAVAKVVYPDLDLSHLYQSEAS